MTMQPYEPQGALTFGQTNLDASDIIPPRVKVVQQMSAEVANNEAEPGDFFNTLTKERYGPALSFVPLMLFKQRIFLTRKERRPMIELALGGELSEGDGLKCRSYDMVQGIGEPGGDCTACPLSQWDNGKPPLCSETYNVAAVTELGDLIILGFQKSSAKEGKRVFSMVRMARGGAAPWTRSYRVSTRLERNDLGNFYVPSVVPEGEATPELGRMAMEWARNLAGKQLDVTPEDADEAPDEVGSAAGRAF